MAFHPVSVSCFEVGKDVARFDRRSVMLPAWIDVIFVDPGNPFYYSEGNCLIDRRTGDVVLGCRNSEIPSDGSVTGIADFAFMDCTGLKRLDFPDSVERIGAYAFFGCSGLTEVTLPPRLRKVEPFAFARCEGLTSVTLPDGIESICERAFGYNAELHNVHFNGSVPEELDDSAFRGCRKTLFSCSREDPQNTARMNKLLGQLRLSAIITGLLRKLEESRREPPETEE